MARYGTDLKLTADGDLTISATGDLARTDRLAFLIQSVRNRLKTVNPDWLGVTHGADLEDLLGLENTRQTGDLGVRMITEALTVDGLLAPDELYVQAVPVTQTGILFIVVINSEYAQEPVAFEVSMDLAAGVTVQEV